MAGPLPDDLSALLGSTTGLAIILSMGAVLLVLSGASKSNMHSLPSVRGSKA